MAEGVPRRATGRRRGRGRGLGQRRPQTWEISDSDDEGAATRKVGTQASSTASERRTAAKALRADQVLSRLAVCVDPAILEDAGSDILIEALGTLGCECRIEPQLLSRSLQWSVVRTDPAPSSVPLEVWPEDEREQLLLLEPQEFLRSAVQLSQAGDLEAQRFPLFRSQHPSSQRTWQLNKSKEAHGKMAISWPEVEEVLVLLQLHADLDVLLVASWQELSQYVCAFTKALSQRPSKQYRDSQAFSFCTAGHWASGQQVAKDGSGLRGVWWRQIRQFNRVSPAVADAVVTAFPSPRLLQQALLDCGTEQERLNLLADLPVKVHRGRQPRRVGPDISRRICIFLTTTNPHLLLDLST
ncbi:putative crossover junction endonuclease EME2 [Microtus ochrogaster]|uniref:Structure-specific endonuclease subunit EME2 n=1 Tax=Microtus ochrogaster TaxID=79684 RepID=A0A8J6GUK0_MICOH|nr:putative crossover junction endonuclease EME2 [Microtus ochrogaster]